jgi:hypothetical protein
MPLMAAYEEIRDELVPIHDHICLVYDSELLRLVGIAQDDSDFYYHCRDFSGGERYMSAVGWIVSLKDCYPADGYARMESMFALNGCPPSGTFLETVLPDVDMKGTCGNGTTAEGAPPRV